MPHESGAIGGRAISIGGAGRIQIPRQQSILERQTGVVNQTRRVDPTMGDRRGREVEEAGVDVVS